jgi:hypothetical protein
MRTEAGTIKIEKENLPKNFLKKPEIRGPGGLR